MLKVMIVNGVGSASLDPKHCTRDFVLCCNIGDPWHKGIGDDTGYFFVVVGEIVNNT